MRLSRTDLVPALVIVAGAVIVHWSLSPDAQHVQAFRDGHENLIRRHIRELDHILEYRDMNLRTWDHNRRRRAESY